MNIFNFFCEKYSCKEMEVLESMAKNSKNQNNNKNQSNNNERIENQNRNESNNEKQNKNCK